MVTVNGATSDLVTIPCGIPQGSVLGPISFLSYMNDFHKCSSLLDFHVFADDANLFQRHRDIAILINHKCSSLPDFHLFADDAILFYRHRDIAILRQHVNTEFKNANIWL